jgi:hypothetical protein
MSASDASLVRLASLGERATGASHGAAVGEQIRRGVWLLMEES